MNAQESDIHTRTAKLQDATKKFRFYNDSASEGTRKIMPSIQKAGYLSDKDFKLHIS